MKHFLLIMFLAVGLLAKSQQRTYCNPMDIGYRYNFEQLNERISYRSGADPVLINHKVDRKSTRLNSSHVD